MEPKKIIQLNSFCFKNAKQTSIFGGCILIPPGRVLGTHHGAQPESNSQCFSWPPSKPRLSDLSSCDPCEHHASVTVQWPLEKKHIAILLMEDIRRSPPGIYRNLVNKCTVNTGINYIQVSTGTGCLPSTVVVRFVSHLFYHVWTLHVRKTAWKHFDVADALQTKVIIKENTFQGLSVIACGGIRHRNSSLETYSAIMKAKAPS